MLSLTCLSDHLHVRFSYLLTLLSAGALWPCWRLCWQMGQRQAQQMMMGGHHCMWVIQERCLPGSGLHAPPPPHLAFDAMPWPQTEPHNSSNKNSNKHWWPVFLPTAGGARGQGGSGGAAAESGGACGCSKLTGALTRASLAPLASHAILRACGPHHVPRVCLYH